MFCRKQYCFEIIAKKQEQIHCHCCLTFDFLNTFFGVLSEHGLINVYFHFYVLSIKSVFKQNHGSETFVCTLRCAN